MRKKLIALLIILVSSLIAYGQERRNSPTPGAAYAVAFASFAPLNTDVFVADANGNNPRPLLPHPNLDYNASFSQDGNWIIFTSERNGTADIYRVRPDGSGLKRLVGDQAFDDQGALSPDGKFLAFVSSRSGQADLWRLQLATGKLHNITNHAAGDFRPSWSPDGQWIAFSSDRDSQKLKQTFTTVHSTEIYLVRPDGSGLRRVTQTQSFAGSPSWSPDGKRLVFYEAEPGEVWNIVRPLRLRGTTQIATVNIQTNERRVLTSGAGEKWSPQWLTQERIAYVSGGPEGGIEFINGSPGARGEARCPSWSADGRRMVFQREVDHNWPPLQEWQSQDKRFRLVRTGVFPSYSPSGERLLCTDKTAGVLHNSLLIMNADGSQRSVLFQDAEKNALCPVWSPRSDRIAFSVGGFFQANLGRIAVADIAIIKSDGSGLKILTNGSGNYGFPSWSPDGRFIVYRSSGEGKNHLLIMNVEAGEAKVLTSGSNKDNFPSWSPTGDSIAFTSYRDGDYELYTIKPDGTDLRRLTNSPGNDAHNAWSPDGKWIAFTSARRGFKDEAALHPYNPQPYGDIYVMRADGSDVRMLNDNQYEEGTPTWIPMHRK